MIELKNIGLIKHIGVSNFQIQDIEKIYNETGVMPSINQIVLNTKDEKQSKLINYCQENEILVQIARPFGGKENKDKISKKERDELIYSLYEKTYQESENKTRKRAPRIKGKEKLDEIKEINDYMNEKRQLLNIITKLKLQK